MATEDKNKRLVNIEIDDDVKRLTITGQDEHDQVVMKQELSDDDLDSVAGGKHYANEFIHMGKEDACSNFAESSSYIVIVKE